MSDLFSNNTSGVSSVVLPCSEDKFNEFIRGLLGTPQTITKDFEGSYEINREDIEHFFHIIDQRISQQNPANCIQFTVEIIFDDGSTIILDSLDTLSGYNEVRPIISTGIVLTWTYLVKFRDKETPEKQVIVVTFGASRRIIKSRVRFFRFLDEEISFRIEHTARTWGADIEALLTNHINNTLKKENNIKKFIREKADNIGILTAFLIISSNIFLTKYKTTNFTQKQLSSASEILKDKATDTASLIKKVDYLINYLVSGEWHIYYNSIGTTFIIYFSLAIFFGMLVTTTAENPEPSFILLTKKSKENRTVVLDKQKKRWIRFIVSVFFSITIGILSNVIYAIYFQNNL